MRYHQRRVQLNRRFIALGVLCCTLLIAVNERLAESGIVAPFAALFALAEIPLDATSRGVARMSDGIAAVPRLADENARLRARNDALAAQLAQLREIVSTSARDRAIAVVVNRYAHSISADCIGYDPENVKRSITIDQGSLAGVTPNAGVLTERGVVGRVLTVTPFSSTVLLLDSYASNIPAIVQRGRYWGIARGSLARVRLDDVALDAALRLGDIVVTGRGRSFPAGIPIGRVIAVSRSDAALSQNAVVAPSVDFARLERVVVLPHLDP